jgi:hypothetical protein
MTANSNNGKFLQFHIRHEFAKHVLQQAWAKSRGYFIGMAWRLISQMAPGSARDLFSADLH